MSSLASPSPLVYAEDTQNTSYLLKTNKIKCIERVSTACKAWKICGQT